MTIISPNTPHDEEISINTSDIPTKECSRCNKPLPATTEFFAVDRSRKGGLFHRCKKCDKEHHNETRQRKKLTVSKTDNQLAQDHKRGTPDQCGACKRKGDSIRGDVDNKTHKRHGYLCPQCLSLVQDFRRKPSKLRAILNYIESDPLINDAPMLEP